MDELMGKRRMNKLPPELENPIDNVILQCSAQLLPGLKATGHTPNIITTYSLVAGLGAVYALWCENIMGYCILVVFSYFFDCVDGQFARRYNMVTEFGDQYDHITDLLVIVLTLGVMCIRRGRERYAEILSGVVVLSIMTVMCMGCQQRYTMREHPHRPRETIDRFQCFCRGDNWIYTTRFCGTGTLLLLVIGFVTLVFRPLPRSKK
jgi:phosphatidylglycerophosphate synthase